MKLRRFAQYAFQLRIAAFEIIKQTRALCWVVHNSRAVGLILISFLCQVFLHPAIFAPFTTET